jgi:hypothetical protein
MLIARSAWKNVDVIYSELQPRPSDEVWELVCADSSGYC